MIFRFFILVSFLLLSFTLNAAEEFSNELIYMIGMVSKSYAESESSIQGENKIEASSGTAQVIAATIQYKFSSTLKRSFYSNLIVPLLPSGDNSFFSGGMGVEFYLNDIGSKLKFSDGGDTLKISPKLTYLWGLETNIDYLVYVTETQKKSDLVFDLGVIGGGSYKVTKAVNIKGVVGVSKGTGVNTSGMGMKVMLGYIHQFD